MKSVVSPPLLSERNGPPCTLVRFRTAGFQVIEGKHQPQKPPETSSTLISMVTFAPMGFGLEPNVIVEVLAVPDLTALKTAVERLEVLANACSPMITPETRTKVNVMIMLTANEVSRFFLVFIFF